MTLLIIKYGNPFHNEGAEKKSNREMDKKGMQIWKRGHARKKEIQSIHIPPQYAAASSGP
jgi:proteasome lid subunit RPN8/RPN11